MKNIIIIIVSVLALQAVSAQSYTLRHKGAKEGIALKILPKDAHSWLLGIDNGYVIERRGISDEQFERINAELLLPATDSDWPKSELGDGMKEFHENAVAKTRALKDEAGLFQRVQNSIKANQYYSVYAFITMRDAEFGKYTGLEYIDNTAEDGVEYVYKVSLNNVEHTPAMLVASDDTKIFSPEPHVQNQEKMVQLRWPHDSNGDAVAYFVERSEDGIHFERLVDEPILPHPARQDDTSYVESIVNLNFTDTLQQNYKPYQYRLQAIDLWGDDCVPSEMLEAMGVDKTAPVITGINVQADTTSKSIKIAWDESVDDDVAQYFVIISESRKSQDSVLVSGITRLGLMEYEFADPIEMKNYYFKVGAVDTSGNIFLSDAEMTFLPDVTAPTVVSNIIAQSDSFGLIRLNWDESKDANMKGYWVYASYVQDRDYMKLTDTVIAHNYLVDTFNLGLLHHKRYYYIEAVDKSFNKSTASEIVEVLLLDTVAPSATIIDTVYHDNNLLHVNWWSCVSEDVISYEIQQWNGSQWQVLGSVDNNENNYSLEWPELNAKELFRVVAIDEKSNAGNDSPSYVFVPSVSGVSDWEISLDQNAADNALQWDNIGSKYKVYQSSDNGYKLLKYQSENRLIVLPNKSYYVKAYDAQGKYLSTSSKISL